MAGKPNVAPRSLASRLFATLGLLLLVLVGVAAIGVASFRDTLEALESFRGETVVDSGRIDRVRGLLVQADDAGEDFVESGGVADDASFRSLSTWIDAGFEDLSGLRDHRERALAMEARDRWREAKADLGAAADAVAAGARGDLLDPFHDHIDQAGELLVDLLRLEVLEVRSEIVALRGRARFQLIASLITLVVGALLASALARRAHRAIVRPLRRLDAAAASLGSDDLTHRVEIEGDRELASLGTSFNLMAAKLEASRRELQHQALHDPLTGLPNRILFLDRMAHAIARSERRDTPVSVLYLDLDGFKNVNDTFGHEAGDRVLRAVADRLRSAVRAEDTVARLGGDEFGILMEVGTEAAVHAAERLSELFVGDWSSTAEALDTGISIGVTTRTLSEPLDELLAQADRAMYAAKAEGKGRFEVFRPEIADVVRRIGSLHDDLQRAIERDEFVVRYQPVVDLATATVVGVEALVRWQHPERGLLPPSEFLPEAERTGHVIPIDRTVLRRSAAQVRSWQERIEGAASLGLHVNLSARQLRHPGLTEEIREALAGSGLAPEHLVLEITETTLIQDPEAAAEELAKLKSLGVRLALDDFGTGFSSLSHLMRFPIDEIKIDRSFISAVTPAGEDPAVVRAMVELGSRLGLVVVAEGTENRDQVAYLRSVGCEQAQGFLFSRPVDAEEFERQLVGPQAVAISEPDGIAATG
jgi:diguanylate cyclase (GGDEF)-like protein